MSRGFDEATHRRQPGSRGAAASPLRVVPAAVPGEARTVTACNDRSPRSEVSICRVAAHNRPKTSCSGAGDLTSSTDRFVPGGFSGLR
jgi:hypothetical protein